MSLFCNGDVSTKRLRTRKVLSIQSHVVHGYVGNKAATFPLQYRDWDVDALNTVQFSNHPGCGKFTGFRSKATDIYQILEKGLQDSLQIRYDAVLTGYLPCIESLKVVGETVGEMCKKDSKLKWVLDPVLGDNGKLYVAEENVPVYRNILETNNIYLVTPNQFEMETLTKVKIESLSSLKKSFEKFHDLYPKVQNIVVTSVELPHEYSAYVICAGYETTATSGKIQYFRVPKLNAHFSGSGDLFSALLLDLLVPSDAEDEANLSDALNTVLSLVDDVLQRTLELSLQNDEFLNSSRKINDLKLIQSADLLKRSNPNEDINSLARFTGEYLP